MMTRKTTHASNQMSALITNHRLDAAFGADHLRDHDGLKGAVRRVRGSLAEHTTVIKSDVHQFYDSMQHTIVLAHCQTIIKDERILLLISQYLNRCDILDGDQRLIEQDIPKGGPLSPLMGALLGFDSRIAN